MGGMGRMMVGVDGGVRGEPLYWSVVLGWVFLDRLSGNELWW